MELTDELLKSGLVSDQDVASETAYNLVMSEGKSFQAIKGMLAPLVR